MAKNSRRARVREELTRAKGNTDWLKTHLERVGITFYGEVQQKYPDGLPDNLEDLEQPYQRYYEISQQVLLLVEGAETIETAIQRLLDSI